MPRPATPGDRVSIASSPGTIYIQLQDVQMRVEGSADPELVRVVLRCVAR